MYFEAIAKLISERTGCDVATIKPESRFSDLGIDSLDTVELLMEFEKVFGIKIPDEETSTISTVKDACDKVAEKLA